MSSQASPGGFWCTLIAQMSLRPVHPFTAHASNVAGADLWWCILAWGTSVKPGEGLGRGVAPASWVFTAHAVFKANFLHYSASARIYKGIIFNLLPLWTVGWWFGGLNPPDRFSFSRHGLVHRWQALFQFLTILNVWMPHLLYIATSVLRMLSGIFVSLKDLRRFQINTS